MEYRRISDLREISGGNLMHISNSALAARVHGAS